MRNLKTHININVSKLPTGSEEMAQIAEFLSSQRRHATTGCSICMLNLPERVLSPPEAMRLPSGDHATAIVTPPPTRTLRRERCDGKGANLFPVAFSLLESARGGLDGDATVDVEEMVLKGSNGPWGGSRALA